MTFALTNPQVSMLRAIKNDDRDGVNAKRAGETLRSLLAHDFIAQTSTGCGWRLTAKGEAILRTVKR